MSIAQLDATEQVPKTIAYLTNQYPKVSHSFIRREIAALEAQGITVARFSIRSCAHELVDADDIDELDKTQVVLDQRWINLLAGAGRVVVQRPLAFLMALGLALRLGFKNENGTVYHLAYLAEACVLLGWFESAGIDHVHAHFGTNSTTVAMLCQALGGPPYSFTVHGPEEFDRVRAISLTEKIKRAEFVVAISSFGKSQLYRWSALEDWPKIHVVRCGLDQTYLAQEFRPIPKKSHFVCVARLSEQKGHLLLLEAVRQLLQKGYNFTVALVGDGEMRSQIEQIVTTYELQNCVSITGWASSDAVKAELLRAQALVLPSFAEGLPVVIMEALALGRPVITTTIAGIPELVETGVNGWLVVPGSVESLVEAMGAALTTTAPSLEAMGQAGLKKVAQQHSADREAHSLARLFAASGHSQRLSQPRQRSWATLLMQRRQVSVKST
ncbi:glycosyltransferase family 4 protein [Phormidium tenue]|uniref:Colanic acid biosynthesis glycosyltransferase WcaL n=1 Tax=Phormidium tenue NIES-30 TaxID=549789 RepID=A0A1U7J861_9CYAN|nr:glycosyltransferase family 4 protein [Phormidium tenue]MBD2231250.1 glycosyltransferase family 4 protein [Phormidium tenue FACHB-1052]OKH49496.1 colanic acid biosynthesis glycosyltransferase WcaL [Phormidium tenue NIES-30]